MTCFHYEGIDAIRRSLLKGMALGTEDLPIKIKLVAPPLYVMLCSALDKSKGIALLNEAIDADPDAVAEIMADFAARLGTVGEELGKTNEGLFEIRNDTLDAEIDRIDERIDRRETSLESLETRLRRQFTALEVLSNTYQSQAAYLGQLQNLPRLDPNRNR